jgi:hypothetical protein
MNEQFKTLDKHGGITIGQELKIVKSGKNVGRFIKMNKRISELYRQAVVDAGFDYLPTPTLERFAELIVRECAQMADFADKNPGDYVLKHFGVEE